MKSYLYLLVAAMSSTILIVGCSSGGSSSTPSTTSSTSLYAVNQDSVDSSMALTQLTTDPTTSNILNATVSTSRSSFNTIIREDILRVAKFKKFEQSGYERPVFLTPHAVYLEDYLANGNSIISQIFKDPNGVNGLTPDALGQYLIVVLNADSLGAKMYRIDQALDGTVSSPLRMNIARLAVDDYKAILALDVDKFAVLGRGGSLCLFSVINQSATCNNVPDVVDGNDSYAVTRGAVKDVLLYKGAILTTNDDKIFTRTLGLPMMAKLLYADRFKKWYALDQDGNIWNSADGDAWIKDPAFLGQSINGLRYIDDGDQSQLVAWLSSVSNQIQLWNKDAEDWHLSLKVATAKGMTDIEKLYKTTSVPTYRFSGKYGLRSTSSDLKVGTLPVIQASGFAPDLIRKFQDNLYVSGAGNEGDIFIFDPSTVTLSDSVYKMSDQSEIEKLVTDPAGKYLYAFSARRIARYDGIKWKEAALADLNPSLANDSITDGAYYEGRVLFATPREFASVDPFLTPASYQTLANPSSNSIAQIEATIDGIDLAIRDNLGNLYVGSDLAFAKIDTEIADLKALRDGFGVRDRLSRARLWRRTGVIDKAAVVENGFYYTKIYDFPKPINLIGAGDDSLYASADDGSGYYGYDYWRKPWFKPWELVKSGPLHGFLTFRGK